MNRRIFIGSSRESLPIARQVAAVIERIDNMEAILWEDSFKPGDITFMNIENIAAYIDGALFIAAPDDRATIREIEYMTPRDNVIFEYGFLVSRLTRSRVAMCFFDDTKLPTDISDVTYFSLGTSDTYPNNFKLSKSVENKITEWTKTIYPLSPAISATEVVHGLSGFWELEMIYEKWQGRELTNSDSVHHHGNISLHLLSSANRGFAYSLGELDVHIGSHDNKCSAKFRRGDILEINDINMDGSLIFNGTLHIRERIFKKGNPPQKEGFEPFRGPGTSRFKMIWRPTNEERRMEGTWNTTRDGRDWSHAKVLAIRRDHPSFFMI